MFVLKTSFTGVSLFGIVFSYTSFFDVSCWTVKFNSEVSTSPSRNFT